VERAHGTGQWIPALIMLEETPTDGGVDSTVKRALNTHLLQLKQAILFFFFYHRLLMSNKNVAA